MLANVSNYVMASDGSTDKISYHTGTIDNKKNVENQGLILEKSNDQGYKVILWTNRKKDA